ncbi:Bromodomain-containing protein [Nosema bombycis CQ1]|uniref:Bromodomain-containing protein n=1 Tax=Nosema bombycis (strain CQ1 / CVCC 102059) TaxID=578461 RepID=R0KW19_NOSB1|nr:Bromodomain-containing protein [Nosema bombycis CQ1]|eukprot:EOB14372.1 Bromodomain-containing protein [Nosema bombycis CQ1]
MLIEDEALLEHQLKYCSQVLNKLRKNANAFPFLEPVDPVKLGIPDYPLKITHPMDLSTIKKKLDSKVYTSPKEFSDDVYLMFNNCYTYNPSTYEVYQMAKSLENIFNEAMTHLPQEVVKKKKKANDVFIPDRTKQPKRNIRTMDSMKLEDYEFCADILHELTKPKYKALNWPFLEPVDRNLIPSYYEIIKNPMDLKKMRDKLDQKVYGSVDEFIQDLRLMIDNCYKFNEVGSDVYNCGIGLNDVINNLISKYEPKDIKGRILELKKKILAYTKEIKQLENKLQNKPDNTVPSIRCYQLSERIDIGNKILCLNKQQTTNRKCGKDHPKTWGRGIRRE